MAQKPVRLAAGARCQISSMRALLRSGLTVRDVAELLRAHPRAIEALIG